MLGQGNNAVRTVLTISVERRVPHQRDCANDGIEAAANVQARTRDSQIDPVHRLI